MKNSGSKNPLVYLIILSYNGMEHLPVCLVTVPGYVDDGELRMHYYANTCLSLAPLIAGSGARGKILEAFGWGLPVVTTDVGLQGLENFRDCVIHIDMDDPEGTGAKIVSSLENREERVEMSERGRRRLAEYNSLCDNYSALRIRMDTLVRLREPSSNVLRLYATLQSALHWFMR